jgi:4-aminobutyrate aminotransferase-like enzyme
MKYKLLLVVPGSFSRLNIVLFFSDLITVGKSIAAGIPLSGVICRAEIMDAPDPGEIGGTFSGNPIGCSAGLKVLEIIEKENLLPKAELLGKIVFGRLKENAGKVQSYRRRAGPGSDGSDGIG